jgi:hypothetical protein
MICKKSLAEIKTNASTKSCTFEVYLGGESSGDDDTK